MEANEARTRFRTIVVDPPWLERGSGKVKRGADRHYPLMAASDIGVLLSSVLTTSTPSLYSTAPPPYIVDEDAHLYLWVTNTFLPDGLDIMRRLGFRYVTNLVWRKPRIGLGQYFRGQHELCLFGVRGKGFDVKTSSRSISSVLDADHRRDDRGRRLHSGKPEEFFTLVEERSRGPFLELFARRPRDGWTTWGNEVDHDLATKEGGRR